MRLVDTPEAMVRLTLTAIRLINVAGAASLAGVCREFPYSGYSDSEVAEGLNKLVRLDVICAISSIPEATFEPIYYPSKGFPFPPPEVS